MKATRSVLGTMLLAFGVVACDSYDDSKLWDKVNDLEDQVNAIQTQLQSLNREINSISTLANAIQNRLYVKDVITMENGYILSFSDGTTAQISNGKDGKDGEDGKDGINGIDGNDGKDGKDGKDAPVISVRDYNGRLYWAQTVDGVTSWLYDDDNERIPAEAVTPLLKVDSDGYWIISYDNGNTYSKVYDNNGNPVQAKGEEGKSFFESVEVVGDELKLVLADGSELLLPIGKYVPNKTVDLGLSVKWAAFNLGAERPEEVGDYYFWGDPTGEGVILEYQAPDLDNISGTEYDMARVVWGDPWRLPTQLEKSELASNCTWTKATVNGVSGMRVTGTNGNSIFLPATGYALGADGPAGSMQIGDPENGHYWIGYSYKDAYGRFGYTLNTGDIYRLPSWNASFVKAAVRPVRN